MEDILVYYGLLLVLCWFLSYVNGNIWFQKVGQILECEIIFSRGFQLWNPFHSIWSTRAGHYASLGFLSLAAFSSIIYMICLVSLVARIFLNIRNKQRELSAMRRIRRLMYQVKMISIKTCWWCKNKCFFFHRYLGSILPFSIHSSSDIILCTVDTHLVLFEPSLWNKLGVGHRKSTEASLFRSFCYG